MSHSTSNLEEGTPIEFQETDPLRRSTLSLESVRSSVLGVSLPFHSHPLSLYSRPKQFPQLLKRSSLNSAIISTTADHPLISPLRKVEVRSIFCAPSQKFKILTIPNILALRKLYKPNFTKKHVNHKVCAKLRFDRFFVHHLKNSKY
ncbi:hypothetical protein C4D60_Mb02t00910 [Musa balbisiana]|uniref:Uncharacterized protein n=1 Tax=Musa balbisiana TaxID=52838 RepID=A0A4S8I7C0_MUSBA|nr:hypothetical protein C4D60_Mb02t00910 [Musa balbisiana]